MGFKISAGPGFQNQHIWPQELIGNPVFKAMGDLFDINSEANVSATTAEVDLLGSAWVTAIGIRLIRMVSERAKAQSAEGVMLIQPQALTLSARTGCFAGLGSKPMAGTTRHRCPALSENDIETGRATTMSTTDERLTDVSRRSWIF